MLKSILKSLTVSSFILVGCGVEVHCDFVSDGVCISGQGSDEGLEHLKSSVDKAAELYGEKHGVSVDVDSLLHDHQLGVQFFYDVNEISDKDCRRGLTLGRISCGKVSSEATQLYIKTGNECWRTRRYIAHELFHWLGEVVNGDSDQGHNDQGVWQETDGNESIEMDFVNWAVETCGGWN